MNPSPPYGRRSRVLLSVVVSSEVTLIVFLHSSHTAFSVALLDSRAALSSKG